MSFRLKPADRQAIDMLLDRQRLLAGGSGMDTDGASRGFSPHIDPVLPDRLIAADAVLGLLNNYFPEEDPPADLVARTMARIEGAVDTRAPRPFRSTPVDATTHA